MITVNVLCERVCLCACRSVGAIGTCAHLSYWFLRSDKIKLKWMTIELFVREKVQIHCSRKAENSFQVFNNSVTNFSKAPAQYLIRLAACNQPITHLLPLFSFILWKFIHRAGFSFSVVPLFCWEILMFRCFFFLVLVLNDLLLRNVKWHVN